VSKFLATIATIIIVVLTVALAAPYLVNWNDYREVFETQASRLVGRPVKVSGNVGLSILPTPEISFEKVQIAGADGRFAEPFAEARAFKMVLSLGQLLSGAIEARKVELVNPVFRIGVDASGRSNWGGLGPSDPAALVLAPREVSLQNVEITGGVIEVRTPHDRTPLRVEGVFGQFDASALNGPFKFAGGATVRGHKFELRLSTGKYERNGVMKTRAVVRNADRGEEYLLDGDLSGLNGPLTFRGPVTLKVGLAAKARSDRKDAASGETLEVKAQSLLTLATAQLDDLNLTMVRRDRPQTLTGSARAEWGAKSRLDLALSTHLLDLEPFFANANSSGVSKSASAETLAALLPAFLNSLPYTPREGLLKLDAGQLLIADDAIENLSLELAKDRGGDAWRVSAARARLPGESQITLSGAFEDPGEGYQFAGAVDASGANLAKFLKWAAPDYNLTADGEPQRFALRGKVTARPGVFALDGGSGELAGSTFTGSGRYERAAPGAESGKLSITAEASRLDLRPLFGESPTIAALIGEDAAADASAVKDKKPGGGLLEAIKAGVAANDSEIDVRAGSLFLPGFEGRNVAAKLRIRDGAIDISKLNVSGEGLSLNADGHLDHYREKPEGSLRILAQADKPASLKTLGMLLGAPESLISSDRRMEALAPLRLEGSFTAARGTGAADLRLGGVAGTSAVSITGKLKGAAARIWEGDIGLYVSVSNPNGSDLLRQIAPKGGEKGGSRAAGPGVFTVKADGSLKGLVEVNAELRAGEVEARFVGKAAPSTQPWTMDGRLTAKAQDAARALVMLDLASADAPLHGGLELNAAMTKSAGHYEFSSAVLRLEGGKAEGKASVDLDGDTPTITAAVTSDDASLPRLLGLFVDTSGTAAPGAALSSDAVWAERAFSFKTFDAFTGSLSLKAQSLNLGGGVTLDDSQLEAKLDQGALRVSKLTGKLWGGKFKADATLSAKAAGRANIGRRARLTAELSLDRADLRKLPAAADGRPLAKGFGDLRLSLSGEGLSPHGLISVLAGQGTLRLDGGAFYGLAPQSIAKAARNFLSAPKRPDGGMARLVTEEFKAGVFPYRPVGATVNIANGVLQIPPVALRSTRGAARVSLMLDLSNLKADSEWALKGKAPKPVRKTDSKPDYRQESPQDKALYENWPPLKMVLAGPLAKFGVLPQQIEAEEFERILTMRKMERDVERLEKLTPGAPPGRVQNEVAGDGGATGAVAAPEATPPVEPAAGDEAAAPVGERAMAVPVVVAPASAQPARTGAASSWRAQTEGGSGGGNPPGGAANSGAAAGGTESPASFENRMRNAIGPQAAPSRPAPTQAQAAQAPQPARQPEAPPQNIMPGQNAASGAQNPAASKQEAQVKKPQEQSKPGDLFDWLMR
jgi:uncharacterized protein involved in outer membrane biogenesis